MPRAVLVNDGQVNYVQNVSVGHHLFQADEPVDAGGVDARNPKLRCIDFAITCSSLPSKQS